MPTTPDRSRCYKAVAVVAACVTTLFFDLTVPVFAQDPTGLADPEPLIEAEHEQSADERIAGRIRRIFGQIEPLQAVEVAVREGVVMLSGSVANDKQAQRALDLAIRLEGVVTVDDGIDRTRDVQGNVMPLIDQLTHDIGGFSRALPLIVVALFVFLLVAYAGHLLAKWSKLWNRLAPNPFLAELIAQAVRVTAIVAGLVIALNLVGATALMGTILGGAGVLGLAIGFAVRDTMENYISSIMLSMRQPFRANEHVVIGEHEGQVMRLTSRATVLMTLDGNHLRIPNSTVFKAVILNYTRNPQRRFDFQLGVDAADDPIAAMNTGRDAIEQLDFVLDEPKPNAIIAAAGDSNIVITFMGWVDQTQSDFGRARSLAIRVSMKALEDAGFTLPEPIYRLRFDESAAGLPGATVSETSPQRERASTVVVDQSDEILDVSPDTYLENKVNSERAAEDANDLLDDDRPVE